MFRLFILTIVACALAPHTIVAQPRGGGLPKGVTEYPELRYGPHQERNTLDLYVPKSDTPLPLIIWVHGGAWQGGSKAGGGPAMAFLTEGYAVASINYRLSSHAVFPAQIEDCKAAVRFLRGNAKKYNLNPDKFGVWGASAGGHLVALLGTCGDVKELEGTVGEYDKVSSRVQCVVDFFGPTDLLKMGEQASKESRFDYSSPKSSLSLLIGGPIQENKKKAAKANPIEYVTKDDAPVLILHGDKDTLVPLAQSEMLLDALKKTGVPAELVVVKDGGHGGPGFGNPQNRDKIMKFFEKHLKK